MQELERHKGHFLNWYHTQTLLPLYPRYVSTVDSGNLAASLLTFKEGLLSLYTLPVLRDNLYTGLSDTINVLREKTKEPGAFQKILDERNAMGSAESLRLSSAKTFLEKILPAAEAFLDKQKPIGTAESIWWAETLVKQCSNATFELTTLTGWMQDVEQHPKLSEVFRMPVHIPSLNDLMNMTDALLPKLEKTILKEHGPEEKEWMIELESRIRNARLMAAEMIESIDILTKQCIEFSDYQYDFLFDPAQHFFSIGYNVEDHRRDPGCYDLLGSEARLNTSCRCLSHPCMNQLCWIKRIKELSGDRLNMASEEVCHGDCQNHASAWCMQTWIICTGHLVFRDWDSSGDWQMIT